MTVINQNTRYEFDLPKLINPFASLSLRKYYIEALGHNIYLHPDLSVVSGKHGLFQSYEEVTACLKTYMHRHSQNRNWTIIVNDIAKVIANNYTVKVAATPLYLYTDGWVYQPFQDDYYLTSIGVTRSFDSYEQAKATIDWYNQRCHGEITSEASFQWNDEPVTIDFMSGEYTLFVSNTDDKDKPTWNLSTNENNDLGLYITPTGALEIVKIEQATIFDNYQKALFAKLRYKRLHKE
jgi:hypothetical protein